MPDLPTTPLGRRDFLALVDHTLLKPEATRAQVERTCAEAVELRTASVCVNGLWVRTAMAVVGTTTPVCSVVGFPLGATAPESVAAETRQAVAEGASEIDMVLPIGLVKGGETGLAASYVDVVRAATAGVLLKVILETALLTDAEVVAACRVAVAAGADFVKTSTGFHPAGGATAHAVHLMRGTVGPGVGVKASGGVRTLADVELMLAAGATRLGMSSTLAVLDEMAGLTARRDGRT